MSGRASLANPATMYTQCDMALSEITAENFNETIESNDTVFIDFWAPWCGPCRAFGPVFEKVAEANPEAAFVKCNTEEQRDLAGALRIQSIPTLMVFRDQILIFRQAGALPEPAFAELVAKVKELDMDEVRAEIAKAEAQAKSEEAGE